MPKSSMEKIILNLSTLNKKLARPASKTSRSTTLHVTNLLVEPTILLAALVARPRGVLLREHSLVVVADHKEEGQVVPANHHRSQGLEKREGKKTKLNFVVPLQ